MFKMAKKFKVKAEEEKISETNGTICQQNFATQSF